MSRLKGLLVVAAALVIAVTGCGDSGRSAARERVRVYREGDAIEVAVGERFGIALKANPTTGYVWSAEENDQVEFVSSRQVPGATDRVGAPGTQRLTFRAVERGSSTLVLGYARPFEPGVPPVRTAEFIVTVTG